MIKKVHINMCPILDGYRVMGVFKFPYTPSCEPRLTAGMSCTQVIDASDVIRNSELKMPRATRAVHNRAAACVAAGGGIFENQL